MPPASAVYASVLSKFIILSQAIILRQVMKLRLVFTLTYNVRTRISPSVDQNKRVLEHASEESGKEKESEIDSNECEGYVMSLSQQ